jgi:hypothetical protein
MDGEIDQFIDDAYNDRNKGGIAWLLGYQEVSSFTTPSNDGLERRQENSDYPIAIAAGRNNLTVSRRAADKARRRAEGERLRAGSPGC